LNLSHGLASRLNWVSPIQGNSKCLLRDVRAIA
jgi:hypothetical protein